MNMIKKQVYKCNVYMEVGCIELFKGTGPMIDGTDFYVPSILGTKPSSIYYTDLLSYIFLFFSILFNFKKIQAIQYFCTGAIACIFSKLETKKIQSVRASLIYATNNSIILF